MTNLVSITSQGQVTIPKSILKSFGIKKSGGQAIMEKKGDTIIMKPTKDFWEIAGTLKSDIKLSDEQLREARARFEKEWADPS